jgi:hypothetical protein
MKMRLVTSGLVATAIMLGAGAAFSGGISTSPAQLLSFNRTTSELQALPAGGTVTTYLNQVFTSYVQANLNGFEPPDPCIPQAAAWNFMVAYDAAHHVQSRFVFEILLGSMAALGCNANVTSITNGAPQPLLAIQPTN